MKLHEQEVEIGDSVYDLLEGQGTVFSTQGDQVFVSFGNEHYAYNEAGKRVGNVPGRFPALLYWQNPIVMIPLKDEGRWEAMKTLFRDAYKIIKDL